MLQLPMSRVRGLLMRVYDQIIVLCKMWVPVFQACHWLSALCALPSLWSAYLCAWWLKTLLPLGNDCNR